MILNPSHVAKRLLFECGFESLIDFPLPDFLAGRGASYREADIKGCDGRIVFGPTGSVITVSSSLAYEGRKRFTIAHELGHHEMHRDVYVHVDDNQSTLAWFKKKNQEAQKGRQEREANEFASELLMPEALFKAQCLGKPPSPELFRDLAAYFRTSITSVVYRFAAIGNHPVCIVYCKNGRMYYWVKSDDFRPYVQSRHKLPPPEDSVAREWFDEGGIYGSPESAQQIDKSTWFELSERDPRDTPFYEYCIVHRAANTTVSVIWED